MPRPNAPIEAAPTRRVTEAAPGSQEDFWERKPPGKPHKTLRKIALLREANLPTIKEFLQDEERSLQEAP
jgi:hypothetical protein